MRYVFAALLCFFGKLCAEEGFVVGRVFAQLGNQLFQIATASAYAWDHNLVPYFPDLAQQKGWNIPINVENVLFRCNQGTPNGQVNMVWTEPHFGYTPIPPSTDVILEGFFQSEKYFAHHREKILKLFAPRSDHLRYMKKKYGWLIEHPHTVAVQIRDYRREDPRGDKLITYGREYFEKATMLFPKDSLFVVSSDNLDYAKTCIPDDLEHVFYLENEPYYIDLYLLSYCKNFIISNSTFGWWAAWMSNQENKIVVAPLMWFSAKTEFFTDDIAFEGWIRIDAQPIGYSEKDLSIESVGDSSR